MAEKDKRAESATSKTGQDTLNLEGTPNAGLNSSFKRHWTSLTGISPPPVRLCRHSDGETNTLPESNALSVGSVSEQSKEADDFFRLMSSPKTEAWLRRIVGKSVAKDDKRISELESKVNDLESKLESTTTKLDSTVKVVNKLLQCETQCPLLKMCTY